MTNIEQEVLAWMLSYNIINQHVVVAVSGGVDSVTLLHVIDVLSEELKISLTVAHVDHGLRGIHGDADRAFVHSLCSARNIQCCSTMVNIDALAASSGLGIEACARSVRYSYFEGVAQERDARFVLTAHTMNDNVETFIMHAARGSGLSGLSGIPPMRKLGENLQVARPLLTCTRNDVVRYAEAKGLAWRHDDSNDMHIYTRNRVRHVVVPAIIEALGSSALQGLNTTIAHSRMVREGVDSVLSSHLGAIQHLENGEMHIPLSVVNDVPPKLVGEFFRRVDDTFTVDDIDRLTHLTEAMVGKLETLSGGRNALRDRSLILITTAETISPLEALEVSAPAIICNGEQTLELVVVPAPKEILPGPERVLFDAHAIVGQLTWRPWRDGDRIEPFGLEGSMLVSDVLTNARVAHSKRRLVHVLTDERGILWVCGYRRCNRALVGSETTQILIATIANALTDTLP